MLKASLERMVALQALILTELLNPVADFAATGRLGLLVGVRQFTNSAAFCRKILMPNLGGLYR